MEKKICFVVMGFGKKKDPETNRTIDLDQTYKCIIRPAVEAADIRCVRADEITESGIIDRSMYALLYKADLVIADISTDNPNALYELGVRHTLKKYSTIIIKEGPGKIPFDIGHNRILNYEHLGNEISKQEAQRCITELESLIKTIIDNPITDSPLYSYIPQITQPYIEEEALEAIIQELRDNENSIYALTEKAKLHMQNNRFVEAADIWKRLSETVENENYYIQQQALCTYKSKKPSEYSALTDALTIISKISNPTDTETLGILGAIYKRLWRLSRDAAYLNKAIENYKKGWDLYSDYYTGENYATCMLEMSRKEVDEERIYYKVGSRKIFEEIILNLLQTISDESDDIIWKYATLSNSYLACGDKERATIYETKFIGLRPEEWKLQSFNDQKNIILNIKD